jgi:hypothetical protein
MHRSSRVAFMLFSVRAAGCIVSVEVPGLADYIPVGADSRAPEPVVVSRQSIERLER